MQITQRTLLFMLVIFINEKMQLFASNPNWDFFNMSENFISNDLGVALLGVCVMFNLYSFFISVNKSKYTFM